MEITRRGLLELAGGMVLLAVVEACGKGGDDDEKVDTTCDGIGSTSSKASGHTHFVCVRKGDLDAPPSAGATYTTSNYEGHTHQISLTSAQLSSLAAGEKVSVTSTSSGGHTHAFDIQKAG